MISGRTMTIPAATSPMSDEPAIALPTGRLLAAASGAAIAVGGGWVVVALIVGAAPPMVRVGLWSAAIVMVAMTAGLLVIAPWRTRPIGLWMSLWLGGTLVRLIVAGGLAYVLYSATQVSEWSVLAGVGGAYFLALISEVIVLAGYVKHRAVV